MIIAIFGESCVGKSTIADALKERLSAQVYSGKDYLRFDKNEARAIETFKAYLAENAAGDRTIIYVIGEKAAACAAARKLCARAGDGGAGCD